MNLNQIIFLDCIARTGNISEAAKTLYVSQPSISKSIHNLEEELGFEILVRTKKGVSFTEQGKLVLKNAQDIVRSVNEINGLAANKFKVDAKKPIKFGSVRMLAEVYSLDLIAAMQSAGINVMYSTESRPSLIQKLQDGSLDVGIMLSYSSDGGTLADEIKKSGLEASVIDSGKTIFVVREGHPLEQSSSTGIREILQYPYMTSGDVLIAENRKKFLQSYGYDQEVGIIQDASLLQRYLRQSDCVISAPECCVDRLLKKGGLVAIAPDDYKWSYSLLVVYRNQYAPAAVIDLMHATIESVVKNYHG